MGRAYTRITTTQRLDFVCPRCAHATTVTATGNTTVDGHNVDSHTIGYAARKHLGQNLLPALGVTHLGDEVQRVLVAAQVGVEARGRRQKRLELDERLRPQRPAAVEVLRRQTG